MTRKMVRQALAKMLCLSVSLAYGQRGKEKEKPGGEGKNEHKTEGKSGKEQPGHETSGKSEGTHNTKSEGNKSPGGEWSQRTHGGKQSGEQPGHENKESGAAGAAAGHAAEKNNAPKASGAQGAAAGAAAAKNNSPKASGAEGAAAGAAAANRNSPKASGAAGAAAGAAAVNRNSPKVSGAAGAAAGAAVAKNNTPTVTGAQGAAVGAAAANRNSPAVSGAAGAATGYAAVRKSFDQPNMYGQQWYGDHPGAWSAAGWSAGAIWAPVSWDAVAGHCGYGNGTPITYNYGENVNYHDGNVLVDGESVGTAAQFSQQAADLAERGTDTEVSDDDQWLPVGVFALVRNEHQHPQLILQLAINKQGILRGNYTDEVTDHTLPIHGAVDKQTQRAAWMVGGNKQSIMEAGMNNLTESEAPALIHKNGKTDHWLLIRLDQPKVAEK